MSFDLSDQQITIVSKSFDEKGLIEIQAELALPEVIPACPDARYHSGTHRVRKSNKIFSVTILDVVNSLTEKYPARITIKEPMWRCPECNRYFVDPSAPYQFKHNQTDDFEDYIAQTMLSNSQITGTQIAERFSISVGSVSSILNDYMARINRSLRKELPEYTTLWLSTICINSNNRTFAFAELASNNQFVLLDLLPDCDISTVSPFVFDHPLLSKLICGNALYSTLKPIFTNLEVLEMKNANPPSEIKRVRDVAKLFEGRGMGYESIRLRMIFQSRFWRQEIRMIGRGNHLPSTFSFYTPEMIMRGPVQNSSNGCYIDIDDLLSCYED